MPKDYPIMASGWRVDEKGDVYLRVKGVRWFTNLDHGKRHERLKLRTMQENLSSSKHKDIRDLGYQQYDNYNAIDVPYTDAIPSDYKGIMGVPISFLDKYCPDQFEIVGNDYDAKQGKIPNILKSTWVGKTDRGYINGVRIYTRIFIKNKSYL